LPEHDLDLLIRAAEGAGEIALRHFGRDPQVWEKADEQGPVTVADLEVDAYLRETLMAARPDYGWMSEETSDDPDRLSRRDVFIVDPIDGTRAFIEGSTSFSHSLAVVRDGQVTAGVVLLPARHELFAAALGEGASFNGVPIATGTRKRAMGAEVLTTGKVMKPERWPGGMPEVTRVFRPSLAYRLCLVAQGRFDAMVTLRGAWEWDIAAGCLIATEAGAVVTDAQGAPATFNRPGRQLDGCIVAPPGVHADLVSRLLAA